MLNQGIENRKDTVHIFKLRPRSGSIISGHFNIIAIQISNFCHAYCQALAQLSAPGNSKKVYLSQRWAWARVCVCLAHPPLRMTVRMKIRMTLRMTLRMTSGWNSGWHQEDYQNNTQDDGLAFIRLLLPLKSLLKRAWLWWTQNLSLLNMFILLLQFSLYLFEHDIGWLGRVWWTIVSLKLIFVIAVVWVSSCMINLTQQTLHIYIPGQLTSL